MSTEHVNVKLKVHSQFFGNPVAWVEEVWQNPRLGVWFWPSSGRDNERVRRLTGVKSKSMSISPHHCIYHYATVKVTHTSL